MMAMEDHNRHGHNRARGGRKRRNNELAKYQVHLNGEFIMPIKILAYSKGR